MRCNFLETSSIKNKIVFYSAYRLHEGTNAPEYHTLYPREISTEMKQVRFRINLRAFHMKLIRVLIIGERSWNPCINPNRISEISKSFRYIIRGSYRQTMKKEKDPLYLFLYRKYYMLSAKFTQVGAYLISPKPYSLFRMFSSLI